MGKYTFAGVNCSYVVFKATGVMGSSKDGVQRGKNTFLTKYWGTFLIVEEIRGSKTKPEKL